MAACTTQTSSTPQSNLVLFGIVQGSPALLTMNGQPLDLSRATVTVDGESANASAVQPGVEISGSGSDDGSKFRMGQVEVRYRAKGMVDQVGTDSLVVVGLKATITANTLIYREESDGTRTPITLADIKAGNFVKVAGLPQADDSIMATRVELKTEDNPNKVELRVRIRDLKPDNSFTYGLKTYTVDSSKAEIGGTLAEGAFVRIKGTQSANTVSATLIRVAENKPEAPTGTHVELKGLVSKLDATTFQIEGLTIDYSSAVVQGTLADGVMVEVKGTLEGTVVKAVRVEVRGAGDDKGDGAGLEGAISDFKSTVRTFVINGITVTVNDQTKYQDNSVKTSSGGDKGQTLTAEAFWGTDRTGKQAEVKGTPLDANTILASKIELK